MPFQLKPYKLKTEANELNIRSFSEEIQLKCREKIARNQKKMFNLGNTKYIDDPLESADALLKREYGNIFDNKLTKAVFIPPVFMSDQYNSYIPVLDSDVDQLIDEAYILLKENSPDYWLKSQFDNFFAHHKNDKKNIQGWIVKMKLLFIINLHLPQPFEPNWLECKGSWFDFAKKCVNYLSKQKPGYPTLLNEIQHKLNEYNADQEKNKNIFKDWLKESVEDSSFKSNKPAITIALKYLFGLNRSKSVGEKAERFLFDTLKQSNDLLSDFVIMHSLKVSTSPSTDGKTKEYDFLIMSAERKLIIAIEVKQDKGRISKARKQLEECKRIFEEKLGDELKEWTFYPVVFVFEEFDNSKLQDHVVTSKTIRGWLNKLVGQQYPLIEAEKNLSCYAVHTKVEEMSCVQHGGKNLATDQQNVHASRMQLQSVIKLLVFCLHISKSSSPSKVLPGPLTTSKWVQWLHEVIDTISTTDTILFYSRKQLEVLHSGDDLKIIIDGGYGTGKTVLLVKKAQMIASRNEKVLFLVHPSTPKSLHQINLEQTFSKNENIIVDNYMNLAILLEKHKAEKPHIFIDELNVQQSYKMLHQIMTEKKEWVEQRYFWVVFDTSSLQEIYFHQEPDNEEMFKKIFRGFKRTDKMKVCFRCTKEILDEVQSNKQVNGEYNDERTNVQNLISLTNFPTSRKPIIVPHVAAAFNVAFEKGFLFRDGSCCTTGSRYHGIVWYILNKPYKLPKYKVNDYCTELLTHCRTNEINLKIYTKETMASFTEQECLNHLHEPNSILVVDSDTVMEGFEWPIVVFDGGWTNHQRRHQIILPNELFRSMVTFICIVPERYKETFVGKETVNMEYWK